MNFRARARAAPLKRNDVSVHGSFLVYFRARARAAPLKPSALIPDQGLNEAFPRARARGPVEAIYRGRGYGGNVDFRARARAAPLKPYLSSPTTRTTLTFPRARARGPVEAYGAWVNQHHSRNFRARARAAPLKQTVWRCVAGIIAYFRARARAAPLKRSFTYAKQKNVPEFPRARARGPVEAANSLNPSANFTSISARARARPR